ncbi:MAG: DNA polymerase III subunit chi [Acidovorax sp.]|jgi:DNA polymerase-3 subunit chi|uniref:DNA polymerase III subunit chi n=1 Tax=Acidovorax sp. TaxID=1872122 RepID=UPI000B107E0C|nr:DNA polymerase III subunit chi [Acidovorax sp.]MCO4093722.1 DNA polymerase III subunit chi [Acidovorax sp.]MDH4424946.1 DNA polymerase III subunit chi [Acidovorax sp.]MDH4465863.1 DNA polymerase III subunit chi [Acidovorax sp.]
MTEVAFHFNAPDKLAYACRFARKVQRSGSRLVITGAAETLAGLDRMLWLMTPQDFVAHCLAGADEELMLASPVLLAEDPRSALHHDVLLNLTDAVPEGFGRFDRVVEVVSAHDEADRLQARTRWRHYASRGYAITRHDLVLKGG